jgi:hypothetical protein
MKGTNDSSGKVRPLALTIPAVIVLSKPNGEPIAATHSPTFKSAELPRVTVGRPVASTFSNATSVRRSAPTTFALNSRLSFARRTVTSSESATTWALVRM